MRIALPDTTGRLTEYHPTGEPLAPVSLSTDTARVVYTATHIVRTPFAEADPAGPVAIDWDATLAFRGQLSGLGEMFDPHLPEYWGAASFATALDAVLEIIGDKIAKVDCIKISLLDAQKETGMRQRLPARVRMYTDIVFLAWRNGHHSHFKMVGGAEAMRSLLYFVECFKMADGCGPLANPDPRG